MCVFSSPSVRTVSVPTYTTPTVTEAPTFGNEELSKKNKKATRQLGTKQLQIPLGGTGTPSSQAVSSGLGIPKNG